MTETFELDGGDLNEADQDAAHFEATHDGADWTDDDGPGVISDNPLHDKRLSWKARGLLAHILAGPTGWNPSIRRLVDDGPDGYDAVKSGIAELEKFGYLTLHRVRALDGKGRNTFQGSEYRVTDSPSAGAGRTSDPDDYGTDAPF